MMSDEMLYKRIWRDEKQQKKEADKDDNAFNV